METYFIACRDAFLDAMNWTWRSVCFDVPWSTNYFWGLILISLFVWLLEILFPWRKDQAIIRKDFWLDLGYMFFNFFVFSIIISGFYRVFDDLPVLWVDHFDNVTPALLESSYPKILARAEEYNFAKLTQRWWVDYINSFRFDVSAKKGSLQMNMTVSGL